MTTTTDLNLASMEQTYESILLNAYTAARKATGGPFLYTESTWAFQVCKDLKERNIRDAQRHLSLMEKLGYGLNDATLALDSLVRSAASTLAQMATYQAA